MGEPLFIHWALLAPGSEQSVTAPFLSSKVLLSFLQFFAQFFFGIFGGMLSKNSMSYLLIKGEIVAM